MAARQEFKQEPGSGLPWQDTASDVVLRGRWSPSADHAATNFPPSGPGIMADLDQPVGVRVSWAGGHGGLAKPLSCDVPDSLGMNSRKSKLPIEARHFRTSGPVLDLAT